MLPAPTNNFHGFINKEFKYPTAFAVQTHIISTACYRGLRVFENSTGGTIIRRTAAVTSCHQQQPCWASANLNAIYLEDGPLREASGTPRTAKYKIAQMQTAVASTFKNSEPDQLAEADDIDSLADFLRSWDVPEESIRKSLKILCLRSYAELERSDSPEPILVDCDLVPGELALDNLDEEAEPRNKLSKEKHQSGNRGGSELLGSDHKQARSEIRSQLQEGHYISHSGKKAIRVVHCLGRCYMLPGVDYLSFCYAGLQFPASDDL